MAAPKGNRFWEARSTHGRNPKFEKSNELWLACCEYFEWVDDNPLVEGKVAQYQGAQVDMTVSHIRAMTISGMCLFLDISEDTWSNYKKRGDDFLGVITQAERIIYNQKFAGAAADMLNANIIARDLGLADKSSSEVKADVTHRTLNDFYDEE